MAPVLRALVKRGTDTETKSLIIAITALCLGSFIAFLQLILSYISSSNYRQKTNAAALGDWAKHTKLGWHFWKAQITVRYAIIELTVDKLWQNRRQQEMKHAMALKKYRVQQSIQAAGTKNGLTCKTTKIILFYEDKEGGPSPAELTRKERKAVAALEAVGGRLSGPKPVVRCSACMLAADLGFDLETLEPVEWEDADKIPPACSTPLFAIRASDLIKFGLLCGLNLRSFDIAKRELFMDGPQSYIFTEVIPGVGSACRYVAVSGANVTPVATTPISSNDAMVDLAGGHLCLAEFILSYQFFGINCIYFTCKYVLGETDEIIGEVPTKSDDEDYPEKVLRLLQISMPQLSPRERQDLAQEFIEMRTLRAASSNGQQAQQEDDSVWKELPLLPIKKLQRDDSALFWEGRWADPATPSVALVMATVSNPSCANGFPHDLIHDWNVHNRNSAQHAMKALEANLTTSPSSFLRALAENFIVHSEEYDLVNNFGCEQGGLRSWLGTNLAEFVHLVTPHWNIPSRQSSNPPEESLSASVPAIVVEPPSDPGPSSTKLEAPSGPSNPANLPQEGNPADISEIRLSSPPIPILNELYSVLESSTEVTSWAESHNRKPIRGDRTSMFARGVLWVQITLLDTWIGPAIDHMMGGTSMREVPVPATLEDAEECFKASKKLRQTTAWNLVRARWLTYYARRLAEGRDGYGDSFLSKNPQPDLEKRWMGMEVGEPHEWLKLDAALTIRAHMLYSMLMSMCDTSTLQQLARNDPLLFIS